MTITLTPEQIAWLEKLAAERGYASVDEAAQAVVAEAMTAPPGFEEPDAEWVAPLLQEAEQDIAEGRTVSHKDIKAHLAKRIQEFRGR